MRANPFLVPIVICVFFMLNLSSCTIMKKIGEYKEIQIEEEYQRNSTEGKLRYAWSKKYIDILYVDMPEDEFVRLFTKASDWTDPERPYITKHVRNKYIISGLRSLRDHRITFENGRLIKFETLGYQKIPVIGFTSWDYTSSLKGYKIAEGLYIGMSDDEFLKNFSNKVTSRFKNGYVILLEDGHKREVAFSDGILTDSWYSGE